MLWYNSIITKVLALMEIYFLSQQLHEFAKKNGRKFTRKQFSLKLAYAITIHKSQGLTLDLIVIDIGDCEFAAGIFETYVVLTRVRRFGIYYL